MYPIAFVQSFQFQNADDAQTDDAGNREQPACQRNGRGPLPRLAAFTEAATRPIYP
jgi:hypothetical protein